MGQPKRQFLSVWILATLSLSFALSSGSRAQSAQANLLIGDTFLHDPSTIFREYDQFFVFSTGRGIRSKSSPDLYHWTNGPAVLEIPPAWTTNIVPGFRGYAWALDLSFHVFMLAS